MNLATVYDYLRHPQSADESELKEVLRTTLEAIRFKMYFDELYGQGLEVANWHLNGDLEPFDNFYEAAIEYSEKRN